MVPELCSDDFLWGLKSISVFSSFSTEWAITRDGKEEYLFQGENQKLESFETVEDDFERRLKPSQIHAHFLSIFSFPSEAVWSK